MRYKKYIIFILVCLILISCGYKINKIVTENNVKTESKLVEEPKEELKKEPKEISEEEPKEELKKESREISEEEKELSYWSEFTGQKVTKVTEIECKLSFYTSLVGKNTASGFSLYPGVVANNMYSFGTDIYIEGFGVCQVQDRGGKGLSTYNNFDVYIPRNYGESDLDYHNRVRDMGIRTVKGYILEFK